MKISLIVAMTPDRVIGINNTLPWHLPAELQNFRKLTMGHPIIMGRKTYDSINRPLPGRQNIVITTNRDYKKEGVDIVYSVEEALAQCQNTDEAFIIGGAKIFEETIQKADRMYLTWVHANVKGDVFFPEINFNEWKEIEKTSRPADEKNLYAYDVVIYDNLRPA